MPSRVRTYLNFTGKQHLCQFLQIRIVATQRLKITGIHLRFIPQRGVEHRKEIGRYIVFVAVCLQELRRLGSNHHRHLPARLVAMIYQEVSLHIRLAQIRQVDKWHPSEKKHQQEIRQRHFLVLLSFCLLPRQKAERRPGEHLHLFFRQCPFGLRLHLGVDIIEQPGIVSCTSRWIKPVIHCLQRAHIGGNRIPRLLPAA